MERVIAAAMVAGLALSSLSFSADAPPVPPPDPEKRPWFQQFTPKREFYVSPSGTGAGAVEADPMGLEQAVASARPGDLYWLLEGLYRSGLGPDRNGEQADPIVWRARPGHRATFPKIVVKGAFNWVWGVEVTNPDNLPTPPALGGSGGLIPNAAGCRLINNVVHDVWGNGIGGWNTGAGHVYYGNVVFRAGFQEDPRRRGYPIYTQNLFTQNGYKYVVRNMFLDVRPDVGGSGYNFHGYSERGGTSGFYVAGNIMSNGRFVLGGGVEPAFHEYVLSNWFYNIPDVRVGYGKGSCQAEFRDNYLARSCLDASNFWGLPQGTTSEIRFQKPGPNVYTGNVILLPRDAHVIVRTTAGQTKEVGLFPLDPADTFDDNTYSEPFKAVLQASNKESGSLAGLEAWRRATAEAGKEFDAGSRVVPPPTEPKVVLLPNEYDATRAHLAIFNWSKAASVQADLSPVVPQGARFKIHPAKNPFGIPAVAGAYAGPAAVPLAGEEFGAFVVTWTPAK